jgi:hypothetical protein
MSSEVERATDIGGRSSFCEGVDPMGRGRAKAKQTKVARQLKYQSIETDFSALESELAGDDHQDDVPNDASEYDDYADDEEPRQQAG